MLTIIACESRRIVDTADRGMDKLEDNKFAHLLQPIRDLAANWDINIANELEDYLVRNEVPGKMQVSLRFIIPHSGMASCRMCWKVSPFLLRVAQI